MTKESKKLVTLTRKEVLELLAISKDLSGLDMRKANLIKIDFSNCDLRAANFSYSNLKDANFQNADLRQVSLWNANLEGANFSNANLEDAEKGETTSTGPAIALNPHNCPKCSGSGKFTPPSLTSEQIGVLFKALDDADKVLGVSELKVSTSWNYRTLHDWILLKFWGESNLVKWTNIILTSTPEQRAEIIKAFEEQVEKMDIG